MAVSCRLSQAEQGPVLLDHRSWGTARCVCWLEVARQLANLHPDFAATPDVMTLDFSGWAVFTSAAVSDDLVTMICTALESRRDRIPWEGEGPLPLDRMCIDAEDAPLPVPLHPAAEQFWRARGYLP